MQNGATIYELPNELLAAMFVHYSNLKNPDGFHGLSAPKFKPQLRKPFWWTHIMLVCRLWRNVAVATSALWSVIDVAGSRRGGRRELEDSQSSDGSSLSSTGQDEGHAMELFYLALSRSAKAPLDILFTHMAYGIQAFHILTAEAYRIRSLTVPDEAPPASSLTPQILQLNLPSLVQLDLLYDSGAEERHSLTTSHPTRAAEITPERYPSLRVLRLSHCVLSEASLSILPQLECIDLRLCSFQGRLSSWYGLLDALSECSCLTELQLHLVLGTFPTIVTQVADLPVVPLEKLTKLVLRDAPLMVHSFLAHTSIPADTTLRVVGTHPEAVDFPPVRDDLISLIPHGEHGYPPLFHALVRGCIHNWEAAPQLIFHSPTAKLSLKLLYPHDAHTDDLEGTLNAFRRLCAGSPLKDLTVTGNFRRHDGEVIRTWRQLFTDFPAIEKLELCGEDSPLDLVCALGQPALVQGGARSHDLECDCPPVCQNLRYITVEAGWEPGLVEALLGVLRLRDTFKLPMLRNLSLILYTEDPDACTEVLELYDKELSYCAEDFSWDVTGPDNEI